MSSFCVWFTEVNSFVTLARVQHYSLEQEQLICGYTTEESDTCPLTVIQLSPHDEILMEPISCTHKTSYSYNPRRNIKTREIHFVFIVRLIITP